ncbi:hypothetical protein ACUSIJ_23975 [Pseudochelatococcus sp. B33]
MLDVIDAIVQPIGIGRQAIRLACLVSSHFDDVIVAYVQGIRAGESHIQGMLKAGDIIEFPITYLPWVELPAEIRFVRRDDDVEICAPFELRTVDEAIMLVGPGELEVDNVTIAQGIVRGVVFNKINGLLKPQLFARINGVIPRAVDMEEPRLMDEGGASFRFAIQLLPIDINDSGLSIELFAVGAHTPLASVVLSRPADDELDRRLIALDARVQQIQDASSFHIKSLRSELKEQITDIQRRVDAFIEYASSFIFDRIAGEHRETSAPVDATLQAQIDNLKSFIHSSPTASSGAKKSEAAVPTTATYVDLNSDLFTLGWYAVEVVDGNGFRWMSRTGIIFNPDPARVISEVLIVIDKVYGATFPLLNCYFDALPAALDITEDPATSRFMARLRWREGTPAIPVQTIRIESQVSASPAQAEGSNDQRILSIAIREVSFFYTA